MRYVRQQDAEKIERLNECGNISVTGSVRGMQDKYGWPKGGQVRVGSYIYNVGVAEVERLRALGLLRASAAAVLNACPRCGGPIWATRGKPACLRCSARPVAAALVALGLAMAPSLASAQEAPRAGREVTREAFMARAERAAVRRFERADTDRNGVLSAAERAEDRQRRRAAFLARQQASDARRGVAGGL